MKLTVVYHRFNLAVKQIFAAPRFSGFGALEVLGLPLMRRCVALSALSKPEWRPGLMVPQKEIGKVFESDCITICFMGV
jgi:hypothetical protein